MKQIDLDPDRVNVNDSQNAESGYISMTRMLTGTQVIRFLRRLWRFFLF